jgi:hypothetical protein
METGRARVEETTAMMMIGDGVLGLIAPESHCLMWRAGHGRWRAAVEWFAAHPAAVRAFAAGELATALWLTHRLYRAVPPPHDLSTNFPAE